MADIDDSQFGQPDYTPTHPGQGGSFQGSERGASVVAEQTQTAPSPTPEEIAAAQIRDYKIEQHVQFLRRSRTTAQLAESKEYLSSYARQISQGEAPFQPQAHHFWSLKCPPGTRL